MSPGSSRSTNNPHKDDRSKAAHEVVASRLEAATITTRRFIDVEEGSKKSYDHTTHRSDAVDGNYGVYCGGGLVGFDIDGDLDDADTSGLDGLPATFVVKTPHEGEHRYYFGLQGVVEEIRAAAGGAMHVHRNWGEIYAARKYLVGPGSRITDCNKDDCYDCMRYGGSYSIVEDRPIATLSRDQMLDVLAADTDCPQGTQSAIGMYDSQSSDSHSGRASETIGLAMPDPAILAENDPERQLWRSLLRHHQHNEVETGVRVVGILDRAEELGIGRWHAAESLMRWIETGRIKKSPAPNRIAPVWAELPGSDGQIPGEQARFDAYQ